MMEITGKFNSAKIFANTIEQECIVQIQNFLDHPASIDSDIRIMPDTHAGKGCVVGFTQTIKGRVVPNLVGVDIGCGVLVLRLRTPISPEEFVARCKKIPVGFNGHQTPIETFDLSDFNAEIKNPDRIQCSIGTLGSGNHFIELNEDKNGNQYVVIHTGSRNLGVQVCNYHQNIAGKDPLAYLEGERLQDYLSDMYLAQKYSVLNRNVIAHLLDLDISYSFQTIHNYIDFEDNILRKGAIACRDTERVIIPLNMRDGSLIGIGKGNPDWNFSGPHGAGRVMSRNQARRELSFEQFKSSMRGIYSETVLPETIDEAPMVYKDANEIKSIVQDTITIEDHIKVIANFKGF